MEEEKNEQREHLASPNIIQYENRAHTGYTKADEHLARALAEGDQQFEQERKINKSKHP